MEKEIKEFLEQHFNHTVDNYEFNQEDMDKLKTNDKTFEHETK